MVNELVAQRKVMRMAMGPRMIRHSMHHGGPGGMQPMADCPMMQPAAPDAGEQPKHP